MVLLPEDQHLFVGVALPSSASLGADLRCDGGHFAGCFSFNSAVISSANGCLWRGRRELPIREGNSEGRITMVLADPAKIPKFVFLSEARTRFWLAPAHGSSHPLRNPILIDFSSGLLQKHSLRGFHVQDRTSHSQCHR